MIELSSAPEQEINLTSLSLFAEGRAHDAWRRLRAEAPVAWNAGRTGSPASGRSPSTPTFA